MGFQHGQQIESMERRLSRLGALVSLATDELAGAEQSIIAAKTQLNQIQAEIERLYITMNEPHVLLLD